MLQQGLQIVVADAAAIRDPATRQAAFDELDLPELSERDDEAPDAFERMLLMAALAARRLRPCGASSGTEQSGAVGIWRVVCPRFVGA